MITNAHPRFVDLTGREFSLLTVIEYAGLRGRRTAWKCTCRCGRRDVIVNGDKLQQGTTRSCGCYGHPTFAQKLASKVRRMPGEAGCWEWTGTAERDGYCRIIVDGRRQPVHRIAYAHATGTDPGDLLVCHHCDNRRCVRPDHLFLGTISDNTRDMVAKNRHAFGERHGLVKHPDKAVRGSACVNSRLQPAQALEIRRRRRAGEAASRLAREFGVSEPTVRALGKGKTWKHLGD